MGGKDSSSRATNMIYTNMLFAMSLDKLVFGVTPGWWSLGGSALILGSALRVALIEQKATIEKGNREQEMGDEEEGEGMLDEDEDEDEDFEDMV